MKANKRKKRLGIAIAISVFFCILLVLALVQKDNIVAVVESRRYTSEDLAKKVEENKDAMQSALASVLPQPIYDLTLEDEVDLITGKLSEEEALKKIQVPAIDEEAQDALGETAEQKIISYYVSQLYGIKTSYLGQLGSLVSQAETEFYRIPSEERTNASKTRIVSKYAGSASSLESQCDQKVSSVLSSMQGELKAIGGDTAIVSTLRSGYQAEKSAKKAYFLSLV